ncbi:nuclear transport factor 2 family protein [Gluconacetobacter tumulicola]|uniref:SnoaL-like domain-containing protein n=1 Tax=Gluconacetobacter tumulicola TaxID=1017177 RepID=A0A7W4JCM9_9PROT|nr:nuclear transport factor 2 family protein [Gluconacetobacter tumulicola]MBB2178669.1 SnoaL-like domain-containing protein [Gluconacetobacter tumulicola]
MNETPADLVRRWYATADTSLLDDDVIWAVLDTFPEGGGYVGRQAVAERFFPAVKTHFTEYVTAPQTFLADGANVATTGLYRVRTTLGKRGEIAFAHFWTIRNGKIVAFHQVADTAALRDLLVGRETDS